MTKRDLHPSVVEFKQFIKKYPKLIESVRNGEETWQNLYEDWYILGPDDPRWKNYTDHTSQSTDTINEKSGEKQEQNFMNHITKLVKNMDADQFQYYLQQLSSALGSIQGVMNQFQSSNQQNANTDASQNQNRNPFSFRKD